MRAYIWHFTKPNGKPMCKDLKKVFERRGLDHAKMLREGIPFEDLRKIKHPSVERVIKAAEADG